MERRKIGPKLEQFLKDNDVRSYSVTETKPFDSYCEIADQVLLCKPVSFYSGNGEFLNISVSVYILEGEQYDYSD